MLDRMRNDKPKLKAVKRRHLLLYLIKKRPDLNDTAIIDLLYFIDFGWYEKMEEQLTGTTYKKRVPKLGINMPRPMDPKLEYFSKEELEHIDQTLKRFAKKNSSDIIIWSQQDIPYLTARQNASLEYEAVFYRSDAFSVRGKQYPHLPS